MAHSEKLLDIIALSKYSFCTLIANYNSVKGSNPSANE